MCWVFFPVKKQTRSNKLRIFYPIPLLRKKNKQLVKKIFKLEVKSTGGNDLSKRINLTLGQCHKINSCSLPLNIIFHVYLKYASDFADDYHRFWLFFSISTITAPWLLFYVLLLLKY